MKKFQPILIEVDPTVMLAILCDAREAHSQECVNDCVVSRTIDTLATAIIGAHPDIVASLKPDPFSAN